MSVIRICAALCLLLAAAAQGAPSDTEDGWFEIEIIVFEYRPQAAESSETWPVDPGAPDLSKAIELAPAPLSAAAAPAEGAGAAPQPTPGVAQAAPPPLLTPFQRLAESEIKLGTLYDKLVLAEEYAPLLHIAWRQPLLGRDKAQPVHIAGATPPPAARDLWDAGDGLAAPPRERLLGEDRGTLDEGTRNDAVDGTITVSRNRYLHVDADLVYHRAGTPPDDLSAFSIFGSRADEAPIFRLRQSRRVRPGELHYFDHPQFGVLARITPFETPDKRPGVEVIPLARPAAP